MLRRFGRRAAPQLWGERGEGGEKGQDKTPMHKLCSFFFFINAVKFPGIVVSISSQAKLIWCLFFFLTRCQFEALSMYVGKWTLYPTGKESVCSWKARHFCAVLTKVAMEVSGAVNVSGVVVMGERSHQKHLEMFSSGKALFLKAVIKKK